MPATGAVIARRTAMSRAWARSLARRAAQEGRAGGRALAHSPALRSSNGDVADGATTAAGRAGCTSRFRISALGPCGARETDHPALTRREESASIAGLGATVLRQAEDHPVAEGAPRRLEPVLKATLLDPVAQVAVRPGGTDCVRFAPTPLDRFRQERVARLRGERKGKKVTLPVLGGRGAEGGRRPSAGPRPPFRARRCAHTRRLARARDGIQGHDRRGLRPDIGDAGQDEGVFKPSRHSCGLGDDATGSSGVAHSAP